MFDRLMEVLLALFPPEAIVLGVPLFSAAVACALDIAGTSNRTGNRVMRIVVANSLLSVVGCGAAFVSAVLLFDPHGPSSFFRSHPFVLVSVIFLPAFFVAKVFLEKKTGVMLRQLRWASVIPAVSIVFGAKVWFWLFLVASL